jgi:very-short-patch-repair endonuclease
VLYTDDDYSPLPPDRSLPADDASELDWLLFHQNQVLSREQVVAAIGRAAVRNRIARGRWQRPARGVVVTHSGPLTRAQRLWVAVLAAGDSAVCAGLTAAALEGLRGYEAAQIHLLLPAARRGCSVPGAVLHRTDVWFPEHVLARATPPHTTMARAVVDAAAWARTDDDARAVVAAAFQQRRIAMADIEPVLDVMSRSRRRALVLETAGYAAGGAHSVSEVDLVRLCRRYRLPAPDHQVKRADRSGRTRYLDAYWKRWRLHVEVDGAWHVEVRAWWADMRRQNDLWIQGDRVLRFPAWVLRRRPDEVAAQIRIALEAGGWSGSC